MELAVAAGILLPHALAGQPAEVSGMVLGSGLPLAEAAVYLLPLGSGGSPAGPLTGTVIDQRHLRFLPTMTVVTPGTEVRFLNSDPLPHNVFGPGGGVTPFDLGTYPEGSFETHRFTEEGVHVILCHIHPEMVTYVVVSAAPYRAVSRDDGTFRMAGVAPGRYRVRAWHPRYRRLAADQVMEVGPGGIADLRITLNR
jgi:plastocyanin